MKPVESLGEGGIRAEGTPSLGGGGDAAAEKGSEECPMDKPRREAGAVGGRGGSPAGFSDAGARRKNDDCYLLAPGLAVVCDGVGGGPRGDVVARMCCARFRDEWERLDGRPPERRMRESIAVADSFASRVSDYLGGIDASTLAAAGVVGGTLVAGSVGDTRVFVAKRDGSLEAPIAELDRAAGCRLAAAMGLHMIESGRAAAHVACLPLEDLGLAAVCSDGVWENVPAERLRELLSSGDGAYFLARTLVEEAIAADGGSGDNATAAILPLTGRPDFDSGTR